MDRHFCDDHEFTGTKNIFHILWWIFKNKSKSLELFVHIYSNIIQIRYTFSSVFINTWRRIFLVDEKLSKTYVILMVPACILWNKRIELVPIIIAAYTSFTIVDINENSYLLCLWLLRFLYVEKMITYKPIFCCLHQQLNRFNNTTIIFLRPFILLPLYTSLES